MSIYDTGIELGTDASTLPLIRIAWSLQLTMPSSNSLNNAGIYFIFFSIIFPSSFITYISLSISSTDPIYVSGFSRICSLSVFCCTLKYIASLDSLDDLLIVNIVYVLFIYYITFNFI